MVSLQNFSYLCAIKYLNEIMENDMTTLAEPAVAHPMTSYKVTRTCPLLPLDIFPLKMEEIMLDPKLPRYCGKPAASGDVDARKAIDAWIEKEWEYGEDEL